MASQPLLCTDVERLLLHTPDKRRRSQEKPAFDFHLFIQPPPISFAIDAPLTSATITDLCSEPLFSNSYLSDEEESSSSETDNMSFSSGTAESVHGDEVFEDTRASLPELLAEECAYVVQQCKHAQAVRLVAAGRARVVQVAKVDIHSSPLLKRASTTHERSTSMKDTRTLAGSKYYHPALSRASSTGSSLPALEHDIGTPMSDYTPSTPGTPSSVSRFDLLPSPAPYAKSTVSSDGQIHFCEEYRPRPLQVTKRDGPSSPLPMTAPPTYSYIPAVYANKPRLVPRQANERATTTIPLLPIDEAMYPVKTPKRPFALRKDSFGTVHHYRETSKARSMRRVESMVVLNKH